MDYRAYEDEHVAGIYRALSLRFHVRYVDMLSSSDSFAGKTIDHGLLPTRRYRRAVDEWVRRPAESAHAALALVEFAGVLAADRLTSEVLRDPLPGAEMDAGDQAVALAAAAEWLNRGALREQGVIRDEPTKPAMSEAETEELRARAAALVAEYEAPLPEGDAGLIAAERRLIELKPRREALRDITDEIQEEISDPVFNAMCDLDKRIATTPASTLAGAAVKLRRRLDPDFGMEGGDSDLDIPCLHQILAVIEREVQP